MTRFYCIAVTVFLSRIRHCTLVFLWMSCCRSSFQLGFLVLEESPIHKNTYRGSDAMISLRGCLHDTRATFVPTGVHSGSLLWLCIHFNDSNRKGDTGTSHAGASSPRILYQRVEFHFGKKSHNGITQTKKNHPFWYEIGPSVHWNG